MRKMSNGTNLGVFYMEINGITLMKLILLNLPIKTFFNIILSEKGFRMHALVGNQDLIRKMSKRHNLGNVLYEKYREFIDRTY